jgi:Phosphotransferase enzyme family
MAAAPHSPDADQIQARLGRNLRHYFPETENNPPRLELAEVSHRSYSKFFLFRTSQNGSGGSKGIAVKVFLPASGGQEAARLQYAALISVWPAFRGSPTMTIPRPLDYFPEFSAIVTECIEGRSLQQLFKRFPLRSASDAGLAQLAKVSGQWLSKFHDATAISPGRLDVEDKLASAQANLNFLRVSGFPVDLCAQVAARLDSLAQDIRGLDLAMAAVHGDFTVDNVLFDGNRIIAIDLGGKDRNAIYHDIATFLNSLALIGLTWPVRRSLIEKSSREFIAGYFGADGYCSGAIGFLRLSGLVSVALEIVGRRSDHLLLRWRIRPYLERLFRAMLKDAAG